MKHAIQFEHGFSLLLSAMVLMATACGGSNQQDLSHRDVALQLRETPNTDLDVRVLTSGSPDIAEERLERFRWTNLCTRKECSATAMSYSRLFHRIALLSATIHEVDQLVARVQDEELSFTYAQPLLRASMERLPAMKTRAASLERRLFRLDPEKDFADDEERQRQVRAGIAVALNQLQTALKRVPAVENSLASLFDEDPADDDAKLVVGLHGEADTPDVGIERPEEARAACVPHVCHRPVDWGLSDFCCRSECRPEPELHPRFGDRQMDCGTKDDWSSHRICSIRFALSRE